MSFISAMQPANPLLLPLSLLAFFIVSAIYFAPIRQQAVWFNKCVARGMEEAEGYKVEDHKKFRQAMAIATCNGK